MSKEHLLYILKDNQPDKAGRLQNALDDYKGSFAVRFYLEAALELLTQQFNQYMLPNKEILLFNNDLDDCTGSFAVRFYLEATLELLKPQVVPVPKAAGTVQCQGCDGSHCTEEHGEIRRLPVGDGTNAILCRSCFDHEMRFRHDEVMRGIDFSLPAWTSLEIYGHNTSS